MPDQAPTTPLSAAADGPVDGATVVIEAPTAEEALTELHQQLGADARIVEVRRVTRGGIAGFFAREVVELHAAPGSASPAAPQPALDAVPGPSADAAPQAEVVAVQEPSTDATPAAAAGVTATTTDSPVDRLLKLEAEAEDVVDFATFLRGQLGDETPTVSVAAAVAPASAPTLGSHEALLARATEAARRAVRSASGELEPGGVVDPLADRVLGVPALDEATRAVPSAGSTPVERSTPVPARTPAPAPMPARPAGPAATPEAGAAWSVANLVKLGLPADLVRTLAVGDTADDLAWTTALAGALQPVCRPLPSGRSLLVGPRARSLANALGVATVAAGQPIRSRATTVAVSVGRGTVGRRWVERANVDRWLHLVIGGSGWRDLLQLDPLAVSWSATEDLPEAVRLATELGLVLGSGPTGRRVERARAFDVALAIRDLLPFPDGSGADGGQGRGEQL